MATEHSTTTITGGHANVVAAGAAGFMSGADKTKLDGISAGAVGMSLAWGVVAAPANVSARFLARSGAAVTTLNQGEYPCSVSGTRTVTLIWSVQTPLATDSVTLTLMVNGSASALAATVSPSTATGSASASIALSLGDRLSIRTTQSATEAQAAWNGSVCLVS